MAARLKGLTGDQRHLDAQLLRLDGRLSLMKRAVASAEAELAQLKKRQRRRRRIKIPPELVALADDGRKQVAEMSQEREALAARSALLGAKIGFLKRTQPARRRLKKEQQARLKVTGLQICHDAARRYVERYVAQQKLAVYRDLLREKRRIYGQTQADYRRRLVTKLDLLAARSDWMAAKSKEPDLVSKLQQADAVLRAYYPGTEALKLSRPPDAAGLSLGAAGIMRWAHDERSHPRFAALAAARRALGRQRQWLLEQNRSELDLSLSLGVHRYHSAYSQLQQSAAGFSLQLGDVTDLGTMFSVRYLLPVRRPEVAFKLRLLKLSQRRIDEQRAQLRRGISSEVARVAAVIRNADAAVQLIQKQLRVARQQIRAAHKQYRNGKLEFQNFIDHWEPYQRARMRYWDTLRSRWLAEADLIVLLNQRPGHCP